MCSCCAPSRRHYLFNACAPPEEGPTLSSSLAESRETRGSMCEADTAHDSPAPPPPSSDETAEATPKTASTSTAAAKTKKKAAAPSNRLGRDDTVVIAGGGIAGLALAAAIQSQPVETRPKVIVLERDPCSEARRQGYGVTLSETNAALDGLGILDDLRARNTRSCAHWTFHSTGRVLG